MAPRVKKLGVFLKKKCKRCGSKRIKRYTDKPSYQCMKCGITDKGIYGKEMWE